MVKTGSVPERLQLPSRAVYGLRVAVKPDHPCSLEQAQDLKGVAALPHRSVQINPARPDAKSLDDLLWHDWNVPHPGSMPGRDDHAVLSIRRSPASEAEVGQVLDDGVEVVHGTADLLVPAFASPDLDLADHARDDNLVLDIRGGAKSRRNEDPAGAI